MKINENIYTKALSIRGELWSSYSFISEEDRTRFINEDLIELKKTYSNLIISTFDLPGLKIGDTCKVCGEGVTEFTIIGIKIYSKDRPGFILDSGWCEEVVKCYK